MPGIDVHQHLMPDQLGDALRRRSHAPCLRGWTLHLAGRRPTELGPDHYDLAARKDLNEADGVTLCAVSLSSPLGIESLPAAESRSLLDVYHGAVAELPRSFAAWAGAAVHEPDPEDLARQLDRGLVGLQLPATAVTTPSGWERLAGLLTVLEEHDRPLLVHPGPAVPEEDPLPAWWLPVVSFVAQQHAAWHAWHAAGRGRHPRLRVCFVGLAGLAPLHRERLEARGGNPAAPDPNVFYETSSYGARAARALRVETGSAALVYGSDRPYAAPDRTLTGSEWRGLRTGNAGRLLGEARQAERSQPRTR